MGLFSNPLSALIVGAALVGASFVPGLNVGVWATIAGGAMAAGATTFAGVAFGAGVGLLAMGASAALAEKPESSSVRAKASKRSIRAAKAYERVIYGTARVGGQIAWVWSGLNDKRVLVGIHVVAAHVCQSLDAIWINGERVLLETNGTTVPKWATTDLIPVEGSGYHRQVGIAFYDGTQTAADSWFVTAVGDAAVWGSNHIGHGYCYVRVALRFDEQFEASGVPDLSFEVKGKKVYDPRTTTTAYSDNPALCAIDWIRSEWATSMPVERIDEALWEAAADDCDELIALEAGGTIKRYTCSLALEVTLPWQDVLVALTDAMAGRLVRSGTIMEIYAGVTQSSEWTLVEDDLAGSISWSLDRPIGELANTVKGEFLDRAKGWNDAETVEMTDAAYLAADGGIPYVQSIDLPGVDRSDQSQRLAKIRLRSLRQQGQLQLTLTYAAGMKIKAWSVGSVSLPRYSMSSKLFRCVEWNFVPIGEGSGLGVMVTLREYDPAIFDWTASEEDTGTIPSGGTANDPMEQVGELATLTLSNRVLKNPTGFAVPGIQVAWTLPTEDPGSLVDIRWRTTQRGTLRTDGTLAKAQDGAGYRGFASVSSYESNVLPASLLTTIISPVHLAYFYEVQARMANGSGFSSDWTTATIWTVSDEPIVEAIYNLTGRQVGIDDVELSWKLPRSRDVRGVEIWMSRNDDLDDATMVDEDVKGKKRTVNKLSSGDTWWWVRYRQQDGQVSPWNVGGAVKVNVSATFGKLAGKDKVGTADIEPGATTNSQQFTLVEKLNVGSNFEELARITVIVPPIADVATVSMMVQWACHVGVDQPATRMEMRLKVDGAVVDDVNEWNLTVKPFRLIDFTLVSIQPGTRRISLEGRTTGGASRVRRIKLTAQVQLR